MKTANNVAGKHYQLPSGFQARDVLVYTLLKHYITKTYTIKDLISSLNAYTAFQVCMYRQRPTLLREGKTTREEDSLKVLNWTSWMIETEALLESIVQEVALEEWPYPQDLWAAMYIEKISPKELTGEVWELLHEEVLGIVDSFRDTPFWQPLSCIEGYTEGAKENSEPTTRSTPMVNWNEHRDYTRVEN